MARRATVNYHVHKTERQAFEIDAGGIKGKLISPELAPTQVDVTDVREHLGALPFAENSVGFASAVTGIRSFDEQWNWQHTYDAELAQLLAVEIGAAETSNRLRPDGSFERNLTYDAFADLPGVSGYIVGNKFAPGVQDFGLQVRFDHCFLFCQVDGRST